MASSRAQQIYQKLTVSAGEGHGLSRSRSLFDDNVITSPTNSLTSIEKVQAWANHARAKSCPGFDKQNFDYDITVDERDRVKRCLVFKEANTEKTLDSDSDDSKPLATVRREYLKNISTQEICPVPAGQKSSKIPQRAAKGQTNSGKTSSTVHAINNKNVMVKSANSVGLASNENSKKICPTKMPTVSGIQLKAAKGKMCDGNTSSKVIDGKNKKHAKSNPADSKTFKENCPPLPKPVVKKSNAKGKKKNVSGQCATTSEESKAAPHLPSNKPKNNNRKQNQLENGTLASSNKKNSKQNCSESSQKLSVKQQKGTNGNSNKTDTKATNTLSTVDDKRETSKSNKSSTSLPKFSKITNSKKNCSDPCKKSNVKQQKVTNGNSNKTDTKASNTLSTVDDKIETNNKSNKSSTSLPKFSKITNSKENCSDPCKKSNVKQQKVTNGNSNKTDTKASNTLSTVDDKIETNNKSNKSSTSLPMLSKITNSKENCSDPCKKSNVKQQKVTNGNSNKTDTKASNTLSTVDYKKETSIKSKPSTSIPKFSTNKETNGNSKTEIKVSNTSSGVRVNNKQELNNNNKSGTSSLKLSITKIPKENCPAAIPKINVVKKSLPATANQQSISEPSVPSSHKGNSSQGLDDDVDMSCQNLSSEAMDLRLQPKVPEVFIKNKECSSQNVENVLNLSCSNSDPKSYLPPSSSHKEPETSSTPADLFSLFKVPKQLGIRRGSASMNKSMGLNKEQQQFKTPTSGRNVKCSKNSKSKPEQTLSEWFEEQDRLVYDNNSPPPTPATDKNAKPVFRKKLNLSTRKSGFGSATLSEQDDQSDAGSSRYEFRTRSNQHLLYDSDSESEISLCDDQLEWNPSQLEHHLGPLVPEMDAAAESAGSEDEIRLTVPKTQAKKAWQKKLAPAPNESETHDGWEESDLIYEEINVLDNPLPADELCDPLQYFEYFFDNEIISVLIRCTNVASTLASGGTKCLNVNEKEMRAFLGILLYMGIVQLPSLRDYWLKETMIHQVANVMTYNRFAAIRNHIHFYDKSKEHLLDTSDRYCKVRPLLSHIKNKCNSIDQESHYSIDESMIPYKGKFAGNLRQYIKTKPHKFGIKMFTLAGGSGMIYDFIPYAGSSTFNGINFDEEENAMGFGAQMVIHLTRQIDVPESKALFFDNFFSSVKLSRYLLAKFQLRSVGTVRKNRIGKCPLKTDEELTQEGRGSYDTKVKDGVQVIKWLDNKHVHVVSTLTGVEPLGNVERYDKKTKVRGEFPIPHAVQMYNKHMGGVDLHDMLAELYRSPHRARKWYMTLISYMMDLSAINSWLIYRRHATMLNVKCDKTLKQFKLALSSSLRADCGKTTTGGRMRSETIQRPRGYRPSDAVRYDGHHHLPSF